MERLVKTHGRQNKVGNEQTLADKREEEEKERRTGGDREEERKDEHKTDERKEERKLNYVRFRVLKEEEGGGEKEGGKEIGRGIAVAAAAAIKRGRERNEIERKGGGKGRGKNKGRKTGGDEVKEKSKNESKEEGKKKGGGGGREEKEKGGGGLGEEGEWTKIQKRKLKPQTFKNLQEILGGAVEDKGREKGRADQGGGGGEGGRRNENKRGSQGRGRKIQTNTNHQERRGGGRKRGRGRGKIHVTRGRGGGLSGRNKTTMKVRGGNLTKKEMMMIERECNYSGEMNRYQRREVWRKNRRMKGKRRRKEARGWEKKHEKKVWKRKRKKKVMMMMMKDALEWEIYLKEIELMTMEQKRKERTRKEISAVETTTDDVDQYERRDTVIINGPSLPEESTNENPADLIVNTLKHQLHVYMTHSDINVAHRLGSKTQGKKRPILVKLQNQAKKAELVEACNTVKPKLYINESLTPKRQAIYYVIRKIRSQHTNLFQQCCTSDGRIVVKLKNSTQKHIITSEQTLAAFLDKHPIFKDTAEGINMA